MNAIVVPPRLRRAGTWLSDQFRRHGIEQFYLSNQPPIDRASDEFVLVEGMWDNPNHWLRLWLVLRAELGLKPCNVVAVLRSPSGWHNHACRKALWMLGVRRFVYLPQATGPDRFTAEADRLMQGVGSAEEFMALSLPGGLPAYVVFDTLVKQVRHPQPGWDDRDAWRDCLAEALRHQAFFAELFDRHRIRAVYSSHAWKNEWAAMCWTALGRNIPFHYMTGHYNSLRVRRLTSAADYRAPNEHLPYAQYAALPEDVRKALVLRGRAYLEERFAGGSDFIVSRYSTIPEQRGRSKAELLTSLGLDPAKPLGVIYAHSWFDFPHTQAMTNFTDPLDWLRVSLPVMAAATGMNWAIKPHPCDTWYAGVSLGDFFPAMPGNVAVIPTQSDTLAIQSAADALVTIQGSIAIEGPALGKRVLCADRSTNTDWGFNHVALSREDYAAKLAGILDLPEPTPEMADRAAAFIATALAPPPAGSGSFRLACDTNHLTGALYPLVSEAVRAQADTLMAEADALRRWLAAPQIASYNAWRTVEYLGGLG